MAKKGLVPNPDKMIGGSYEAALEIIPVKINEITDENIDRVPDVGILKIEDGPRYKDKTVKQLKEMCRNMGLLVSGKRLDLINRIAKETIRINDKRKDAIRKKNLKKIKEEELIQQGKEGAVKEKADNVMAVLERRERVLFRNKDKAMKELFVAQQKFDNIEAQYNEVKITLTNMKSLF